MKIKILSLTINTLLAISTFGQTAEDNDRLLQQKLPAWTINTFKKLKLATKYQLADYINPYYLEADFNGDNNLDIAITIEQKETKNKGIIIFHGLTDQCFVFGAGTVGIGGDNFDWMDIWKVYRETSVRELTPDDNDHIKLAPAIKLKGQGLLVEKSESAGGVIYWDGQQYKWAQTSD